MSKYQRKDRIRHNYSPRCVRRGLGLVMGVGGCGDLGVWRIGGSEGWDQVVVVGSVNRITVTEQIKAPFLV